VPWAHRQFAMPYLRVCFHLIKKKIEENKDLENIKKGKRSKGNKNR
jgi:hypothetical protein